jgi:hypothetical protein
LKFGEKLRVFLRIKNPVDFSDCTIYFHYLDVSYF